MTLRAKLGLSVILTMLSISVFISPSFAQSEEPNPQSDETQNNVVNEDVPNCQAKERDVKGKMNNLLRLAGDVQFKFDAVANRVEIFYTSVLIPSNKIVPEYSKLVTEIQVSRSAVLIAINKAKGDVELFSCGSGQPKTQVSKFKRDMQGVTSALKKYRTSIKDLIVSVSTAKELNKPADTFQQ